MICEKNFASTDELAIHMKEEHSQVCGIFELTFATRSELVKPVQVDRKAYYTESWQKEGYLILKIGMKAIHRKQLKKEQSCAPSEYISECLLLCLNYQTRWCDCLNGD